MLASHYLVLFLRFLFKADIAAADQKEIAILLECGMVENEAWRAITNYLLLCTMP